MGFFKKEPKILVVDDDRGLTDNLVQYLKKMDYQAFPAYGGREGLTKFEQDDFQVVITDLKMPEMDGMELLEEIKKLDNDAIVIILTGYGTIESSVAAVKKGAYDYISKPLELKEIELIVNRALEKHTIFSQMRVFRGLTVALIISVPVWLILGIILAKILLK